VLQLVLQLTEPHTYAPQFTGTSEHAPPPLHTLACVSTPPLQAFDPQPVVAVG
jgi:hypothetical protein